MIVRYVKELKVQFSKIGSTGDFRFEILVTQEESNECKKELDLEDLFQGRNVSIDSVYKMHTKIEDQK